MNAKHLILILVLALTPQAFAQGFAGLGSDADGFAQPSRNTRFTFPQDHGPHTDFRIEWWYITANLTGPDGTDYGIQWTLFRSALTPDGQAIWLGHAALTTPTDHFVAERLARGGIGQAGVTAQPFEAWIDDWQMSGIDGGTLKARGFNFAYALTLNSTTPFVPQGDSGYSVKSASGQASHYYSQPFYTVTGTLDLPDGPIKVTGQAWLDREWSSQPLAEDQSGWDWFSLHLDDGAKLMGFRLRADSGDYTSANWIEPDGTPHPLPPGALQLEPLQTTIVNNREIPTTWRLRLPAHAFDVTVTAINPQSWMATSVPYWEGPVRATGSHPGRGYLEMTGYD